MHTHPFVKDRSLACLFATGLLVFGSTSANAAYTVIDDDLQPTSVIEARATPPAPVVPDHYTIPFTKDHTPLDVAGRAVLDALIPQMHNESIDIIGRPDANVYSNGKLSTLARNRAINIRDYLTRQGVPSSRITIHADDSPNPQPNGSSYPCDIYITNTDSRASAPSSPRASSNTAQPEIFESERYAAARAYASMAQPVAAAPVFAAPVYAPTVAAPASPAPQARDEQLIQFINEAVQSGKMHPTVALKLLRSLMESGSITAPQQPQQPIVAQSTMPQQRTPALAPVSLFVASPAFIRNDHWVLDKALTLRDNLNAWSKLAGWNPSVWDASNLYQVTSAATLDGGFPDVLRQIADSTGLNICAKAREKVVRVTDAAVSCK